MKVLAAVVTPPHLASSGAMTAALMLSKHLRPHCDIDIAFMADRTQESHLGDLRIRKREARCPVGFVTHRLPNRIRTLLYRSDIPQLVSEYDLVHIHNPMPALEMKRIAAACVSRNIPYVITTHGFVEVLDIQNSYQLGRLGATVGRLLVNKPLQYVLDHADKICCLAPHDEKMLRDHGVATKKLTIIPNGVNADLLEAPPDEAMQATRTRFGIPADEAVPVCFFLANHTRNKGLDILLEGFLASSRPYCLVVGGKKRDFDYARYVARTGPGQQIVVTDMLTDAEIHCLHYCSDLFVFPTRADTLPLVILEAMAAGRPVLSTRVGGIPYQVDDDCGRLVEPNDAAALCQALEEMIDDLPRLRVMGQAARARAQELFNWKRSAERTARVYRDILSVSPPADPT